MAGSLRRGARAFLLLLRAPAATPSLTRPGVVSGHEFLGAASPVPLGLGPQQQLPPPPFPRQLHHQLHQFHSLSASHSSLHPPFHATTVVCVRKGASVVIMGDGQVTLGSQIMKPNVRKVRRLGADKSVIAGFAGAAADGFTLFERLEARIDEFPGQLTRAAVELAKTWRTDKYLRKLDAVMVVADSKVCLMLSGNGDVLEPNDGIIGIGAGGPYALAAARALKDVDGYDAEKIATKAMKIAAESCIYTNDTFTMEKIDIQSE